MNKRYAHRPVAFHLIVVLMADIPSEKTWLSISSYLPSISRYKLLPISSAPTPGYFAAVKVLFFGFRGLKKVV